MGLNKHSRSIGVSEKYWKIIKDLYKLFIAFYEGNVTLGSINTSFIVLVLKINILEEVRDFKPISLLNCYVKIVTKLLVERL